MICQAISNLIDNSIKFISKGDTISITIEQRKTDNAANNPDKQVVVVVHAKDIGEGLDQPIVPKLFKNIQQNPSRGPLDWDYIFAKTL